MKLTGLVLFTLGAAGTVHAQPLRVVYESDFGSDPGWVTNDPTNLHWQSGTGTFRATLANQSDSIAFIPVDWDGQRFQIEYDLKVNSCQYSAERPSGCSILSWTRVREVRGIDLRGDRLRTW